MREKPSFQPSENSTDALQPHPVNERLLDSIAKGIADDFRSSNVVFLVS